MDGGGAGGARYRPGSASAVKDGVLLDQVVYAATRDPGLPYTPAG